jgi:hypothetical protein
MVADRVVPKSVVASLRKHCFSFIRPRSTSEPDVKLETPELGSKSAVPLNEQVAYILPSPVTEIEDS